MKIIRPKYSFLLTVMVAVLTVAAHWAKAEEPTQSASVCNIALLGDSMTWIGGDNCEKPTGWSYYLRERFPQARITTYARSGATWTNTPATRGDIHHYTELLDDENVIYNQALRLITDSDARRSSNNASAEPDVIIIFAGGNDAMFSQWRPGLFDASEHLSSADPLTHPSKVTTLAGSVELTCHLLQRHFPAAQILLVTPTEFSRVAPELTAQVGDTIQAVANRIGITSVRADHDVDIRHHREKQKPHLYTYDGVHSNPAGARLIADFIITYLNGNGIF